MGQQCAETTYLHGPGVELVGEQEKKAKRKVVRRRDENDASEEPVAGGGDVDQKFESRVLRSRSKKRLLLWCATREAVLYHARVPVWREKRRGEEGIL
jgi:hypothetical protein